MTYQPGDRVRVRRFRGWQSGEVVAPGVTDSRWRVCLDGATKAAAFHEADMRPERAAPAPAALTRQPDYERPELREVPHTGPVRDAEYLGWLRDLPCTFCGAAPPSEPSHHGLHGTGTKAGDDLALPSCRPCHDRHHRKGAPLLDLLAVGRDVRRDLLALLARNLRARWEVGQ